jgi:uncharacterized protein YjbI with pentapeptide repeats
MGRIVELPSIKPRSTSRHQGLRKLSPDHISKARDETATQVTRVGLTFLGTAAFCLLSLLTPDSALLGGSEKINVPFAGSVSVFGLMLLGPAVLIMLRVYLQIYVEHSDRLDRLARSVSVVRAPTLVPLQNSLIRVFSGLTFYLLLPVTMMLFAWKAAVFPRWGSGLLCVATGVVVSHVMLPFTRFTWRSKALLSITAIIAAGVMFVGFRLFGLELPRRPFDLFRANLSGQWLLGEDLRKANLSLATLSNANLSRANLSRANLIGADLSHAHLSGATLSNANLSLADLSDANLGNAGLSGANLSGATLSGANLSGANLSDANLGNAGLSGANLSGATLSNANLRLAGLSGANLSRADLSDANLGNANLIGAHLSGATLSNANLSLAGLSGANLSGANLSDANLGNAGLSGANLSGATLSGVDLSGANLFLANLSSTYLGRANLSGANLLLAENLTQTQLDEACGNSNTKLPEGLTMKRCSTD